MSFGWVFVFQKPCLYYGRQLQKSLQKQIIIFHLRISIIQNDQNRFLSELFLRKTLHRSISVNIIQSYFKSSSIIEMSFLYILNNGYVTLTSYDQIHGYYQNLGPIYQNNQQNYVLPNYSISWPQNDITQQFGLNSPTLSTFTQPQELPNIQKEQNSSTSKKKIEKTLEKEILSAKKNSQSNIINQFYSFFSSRLKSQKIVQRCCLLMGKSLEEAQKILNYFYATIRFINLKRGRKYVNTSMFLKFFSADQFTEYLDQMKDKIEALDFLKPSELCQLCRRCAKYFLKNISISAILTSKRISMVSKEQHLKKRRKIMRSILNHS